MKSETIYQIILSVLADEATDEEHSVLNEWLAESEQNKEEYAKIRQLYDYFTRQKNEKKFNVDKAWLQVSHKTVAKKRVSILRPLLRYAAMLAVLFAIGLYFFTDISPEEQQELITMKDVDQPTLLLETGEKIALNEESFSRQQKETVIKNEANSKLTYEAEVGKEDQKVSNNHLIIPHGKTYQVVLADDTKIWLNSESELIYPTKFTGDKREVTLIGEAFFEVTENKAQPFVVKTGGMEVEVLGTSFNVSSYKDESSIVTTLVEGSVAVQTENGDRQLISPSEQLVYHKELKTASVYEVNTDLFTSWIDGVYTFKDIPLENIIVKLQRWHNFTVKYQDESLRNRKFTFTANRETGLDVLLEVLNYTTDVKLEREENSIYIKKERRE